MFNIRIFELIPFNLREEKGFLDPDLDCYSR